MHWEPLSWRVVIGGLTSLKQLIFQTLLWNMEKFWRTFTQLFSSHFVCLKWQNMPQIVSPQCGEDYQWIIAFSQYTLYLHLTLLFCFTHNVRLKRSSPRWERNGKLKFSNQQIMQRVQCPLCLEHLWMERMQLIYKITFSVGSSSIFPQSR